MFDDLSQESRLLMYLADELPLEERVRVEAMLERDPSLRAQFDSLRDLQEHFHSTMQSGDASARMMVTESSAVRKVGRAMQQWQVDRFQRPSVEHAEETRLAFPWWCYPLATAAAAVFALIVWVGNDTETPTTLAGTSRVTDPTSEIIAQAEESWAVTAEPADAGPQPSAGTDELNAAFGEQTG